MIDRFPKQFDSVQHERLRELYGDLVPTLDFMVVRRGLYCVVDRMFAELSRLPGRHDLRVVRVESRNAGWLVVVTTGEARGASDIIAAAESAARDSCEHCGKPADMVLKVGLESLLTMPRLQLGDRLLCVTCTNEFTSETSL